MFPPITWKLQKIKIDEKLTNFENSNDKKVKKSPLFSILWHLGSLISAPDHLVISLERVEFKRVGKINKKMSLLTAYLHLC